MVRAVILTKESMALLCFMDDSVHHKGILLVFYAVKAIEQFQKALEISPKSLASNYGLASALLGLSKECINTGAFRWGASLLEVLLLYLGLFPVPSSIYFHIR